MTIDWTPLDAALERRTPEIWWRDDDAIEPTPALDRLIGLADSIGAPLHLASIPAHAEDALAMRIKSEASVSVGVHGWTHMNHAPPDQKKAEFGAYRPLAVLKEEAQKGLDRINALFGAQAVPIFIPPWNRIAPELPEQLADFGCAAYSTYAHREIETAPLLRIDAHIDPIDWRGNRSAVDPQKLITHVAALLDGPAPIGLMTHHLVHDEPIWELTGTLVRRLSQHGAKWIDIRTIIEKYQPNCP